MPEPATASTLSVEGPGSIIWTEQELPPVKPGRFLVETLFSGVSAGTELTYVKGVNPFQLGSWNPVHGLFLPGEPTTPYPVRGFGYMQVGRVVRSAGAAVGEGALVAMAYGHRTAHVADESDRFVELPPGLDPLLGIYAAHMGPICANGLLHAAHDLYGAQTRDLGDGVRGRRVAVTGAGVVGLLTALFAREHGAAEVVVVDETAARLRVAGALGLATTTATDEELVALKLRWRHTHQDRGADVVFQCRGQARALALALRLLRPQGTVIDLAFYPAGADEVRLGEEFHHNGLTIRCAQIGRVPRGLAHAWDRERLSAETLRLLRSRGAELREHVVTDLVPFVEAPRLLLDLAVRRRHAVQAVLGRDVEDERG